MISLNSCKGSKDKVEAYKTQSPREKTSDFIWSWFTSLRGILLYNASFKGGDEKYSLTVSSKDIIDSLTQLKSDILQILSLKKRIFSGLMFPCDVFLVCKNAKASIS